MKKFNKSSILAVLSIVTTLGLIGPIGALASGPAAVNLLSANNFVIVSQTGITNTGSHTSTIKGNIGSSPITGAAMNNIFCSELTGTIYGVDAAYVGSGNQACFAGNPPSSNKTLIDNAVLDIGTAYTDAAGRTIPDGTELYAGNIGGQTFAPGLYKWSSDVTIPTDVTLSGTANDVWIFQIAGDLSVASAGSISLGTKVILTGGAKASNVFWQVGGLTGATLGTYSTFNGNILSAKQIILQTGAVLNGRALSQTQVTLDANVVSLPIAFVSTPVQAVTPVNSNNVIVQNPIQSSASAINIPKPVTTITTTKTVSTPSFPNTGFPPEDNNILRNIVIISLTSIASLLFYTIRRRQVTMKSVKNNSIFLALAVLFVVGFVSPINTYAFANPSTVNLLGAASFDVLAKTAITTTGVTSIIGDIGLSPAAASFITGFGLTMDGSGTFSTSALVGGRVYASNYTAPTPANMTTAISNMQTAYTDAAGRAPDVTELGAGNIGGLTIARGVYKWSTDLIIPTDVTLSGTASDVWIFEIAGDLTISSAKKVILSGGALASNVFWQVAGSNYGAVLGTTSTFNGTILSLKQVIMQTGAVLNGRALAQTQVTMDANNVSASGVGTASQPTDATPARRVPEIPQILPLINITKIPNPLALPSGAGYVTYTYTLTNIGLVPMSGVSVEDDKCYSVKFVSGDDNKDSKLDMNESWFYRCTKIVSATETNTAKAHGFANNGDVYDTASATVVVGASTLPPIVHLITRPNAFVLPVGGGAVTYIYSVSNPGTEALNNVSINDDRCTGLPGRVVGHPGDLNKNDLLESNEVWTFTCQTNITQTTTNTGTVVAYANGFATTDVSPATVVVATPGFPNTGFPPIGINSKLEMIVSVIGFGLVAFLLVKVLRKSKV